MYAIHDNESRCNLLLDLQLYYIIPYATVRACVSKMDSIIINFDFVSVKLKNFGKIKCTPQYYGFNSENILK